MKHIEVVGSSIAYQQVGDGPLVVLLHGGLSDSREWRRQLDGLSDSFTVVAWDAPGCGRSSDPPRSFRMPDYADRLSTFIGALALGRPHVVGLSWGSVLALELYRRYPKLPVTLVLASAYAGWTGSLSADVVADRLEGALRDLELPPEEFARSWIPSLFTDQASTQMVDEVVAMMSEFHPIGARAMLHSMAEADLHDVLPYIEIPTLLLYGEADVRSPLLVAEELHAQIRGSKLVVIPGVGHQSNVEAGARFNSEVRAFLQSQ